MATYIVPKTISSPPTGNAVGTTLAFGRRQFQVMWPAAARAATPTTGQIWPRGNW